MQTLRPYLVLLWFPLVILLAARALPAVITELPANAALYPAIAGGFVALIALWFKRARITQLAVTYGLFAYFLLAYLPNANPTKGYDGQVIFALITLLIPINALIIAFLPNRMLLSPSGMARVLVILLQGILIFILGNEGVNLLSGSLATSFDGWMIDLLHFRLFPKEIDYWTYLPQPSLIAIVIAAFLLLLRLMVTSAAEDAAFLFSLLGFAVCLHHVDASILVLAFALAVEMILLSALVHEAYRMAFVDELTEIANRRALESLLSSLRGTYTVAMVDIDHFKKFNDTYGHDVGDQVLKMVAGCIAQTGSGGRPFRYGGEEFTVVFPGKTSAQAEPALEALRLSVQNAGFALRSADRPEKKPVNDKKSTGKPVKKSQKKPETVSVTISIGMAMPDEDTLHANDVVKSADQALYKAKKAGRNRIAE